MAEGKKPVKREKTQIQKRENNSVEKRGGNRNKNMGLVKEEYLDLEMRMKGQ